MEENQTTFSYTYSAAQQAEVERIRNKYAEKPADKMEQLRRLDRSATQRAQIWALTLGVLGTLILGTGMSLAMTDLGQSLGALSMLIGIAIGLVGILLVALAYPVYSRVLKKARARIAPEILRLTDELLK